MMPKIQKADPLLRKKVFIAIGICAIIGVILLQIEKSLTFAVAEWIVANQNQTGLRVKIVFLAITTLFVIPLLAFSVYFRNLGKKIIYYRQFPPPKVKVVKDTPVLRGKAACKRGRLLKLFSIFLVGLVFVLISIFWKLSVIFSEMAK